MSNSTANANGYYRLIIHRSGVFSAIAILVIGTCGMFGNVLSFLVYARRNMRSSNSILLAALSVVDFFLILLAMIVFVLHTMLQNSTVSAYILKGVYPWLMTSQTLSIWLLTLISFERFIAIQYPFSAKFHFSIRRSKLALMLIAVFSILYNLPRFWEFTIVWVPRNASTPAAQTREHLKSNAYYKFVFCVALYLITHYVIPLSAILAAAVGILRAIRLAARQLAQCHGLGGRHVSQEHKLAKMMLVIILIFIACNSMPSVLYIVEAVRPGLFGYAHNYMLFVLMNLGNVLVVVNSSVNVFVYYRMNSRYRRIVRRLLCRWRTGRTDASMCDSNAMGSYGSNTDVRRSLIVRRGTYCEMVPFKSSPETNTRTDLSKL